MVALLQLSQGFLLNNSYLSLLLFFVSFRRAEICLIHQSDLPLPSEQVECLLREHSKTCSNGAVAPSPVSVFQCVLRISTKGRPLPAEISTYGSYTSYTTPTTILTPACPVHLRFLFFSFSFMFYFYFFFMSHNPGVEKGKRVLKAATS